jgi:hypothetical protein
MKVKMIFRNKYFKNLFFFLLIFVFSCVPNKNKEGKEDFIVIDNVGGWDSDESKDKFDQIITIDTGINSVLKDSSKILLKTREGCSKTEFILKEKYFADFKVSKNLIVISTIDELERVRNDYFDLSFLDTFSTGYFDNNYLCFVLAYYTGSWYPKSEHIKVDNGKYYFEIEYWNRSLDDKRVYVSRSFKVFYIIELPKN